MEEENYSFTIDPDSGDVSLFIDMDEYFPEGYLEYTEGVDPIEIAMEDPKVKEMITDKKYKFGSPFYFPAVFTPLAAREQIQQLMIKLGTKRMRNP